MSEFLEELRNSRCVHGLPVPEPCEWCEREEAITLKAHDAGQISAAIAIVHRLRSLMRDEMRAAADGLGTADGHAAITRCIEVISREYIDDKQKFRK